MAITIDATAGKAIPQSTAEWAELQTAAGSARGTPGTICLAQELSGDPVDVGPDARTITVAGTGLTQGAAVSGWTSLGYEFTEGGTNRLVTTVPNVNVTPTLILAYVAFTSQSALRTFIEHANMLGRVTVGQVLQINAASNVDGLVDFGTGVRPVWLQSNSTDSRARMFNNLEMLSATFGAFGSGLATDPLVIGGSGGGGSTTPGMTIVYGPVIWTGDDARMSEAEINALMLAAGWAVGYTPPPWNLVEYTATSTQPIDIESLVGLPDGSVFGNAEAYSGFFADLEWFGAFLTGPSRPQLIVVGGYVYIVGYPNGLLLRYAIGESWTYDGTVHGNPAVLGVFGASIMKYSGFIEYSPTLNQLIVLGRRERDEDGCGIGIYDIASGEFGATTQEQLEDYRAPRGFVVLDDVDRVVASCDPHPDAGLDQAQLLVYTRDLTFVAAYTVQSELMALGKLFSTPTPGVVMGVSDYAYYLFNVLTGTLVDYKTIGDGFGASTQDADGVVWAQKGPTSLVTLSGTSLDASVRGDLTAIGGDVSVMAWAGSRLHIARGPTLFEASGAIAALAVGSWWGGWYPRGFGKSWWGYPERTWFPEGLAPETTPGTDPPGAATFVLLLEAGTRVTYSWATGIHKSYNGRERRAGLRDDPALKFEGPALMSEAETRATRARLARYAAQGLPFLLALPYEELSVRADSVGSVVAVHSTLLSDWCVIGARVVVRHVLYGAMDAVIQSSTSNTITLDVTLGDIGKVGASIMPTLQVFLDPTQQFSRYPVKAERWALRARNAVAGFSSSALKAELALEAPLTNSGALDGMRLVALTAGADGNLITVQQSDDALTSGGDLIEDVTARTVHIKYAGDDTTMAEYVALLASSSLLRLLGTYTDTDVLASSDDEFAATALAGGADATPVPAGIGATLTTFSDRPVWDRGIDVEGTTPDSMQSMAKAQDFGGLPFSAGMAAVPDWGRDVKITAKLGAEFQWFKLFLATIRGAWKSFWLPTYRRDLEWVSSVTGGIKVTTASDVNAWYPTQQTHVQIVQVSGAVTYARVTGAVDNGDETTTLTLVDEADAAVTLSGGAVDYVSWLELVRLEGDDVTVAFNGHLFGAQMTARVLKQAGTGDLITAQDYEQSPEDSTPREGVEWEFPEFTQRDSTGTRDCTIDGKKFTARATGRADISVPIVGEDADLIISVPLTHAAAVRWLRGGIPPRDVSVNVWRRQPGGVHETNYRGVITSMAQDGNHTAKFRVSSRMSITLARRLPIVTVGRSCGHLLYDEGCQVDRVTASSDRTIMLVDGRNVTFTPAFGSGDALKFGILRRSTGEEMTIADHVGNVITLQFPIGGLTDGEVVTLSPGCDHTIEACRDDYSNVANFGNAPYLPTRNVFKQNGLPVVDTPEST